MEPRLYTGCCAVRVACFLRMCTADADVQSVDETVGRGTCWLSQCRGLQHKSDSATGTVEQDVRATRRGAGRL